MTRKASYEVGGKEPIATWLVLTLPLTVRLGNSGARAMPTSARNSLIRPTAVWRSRFWRRAVRTSPTIVESWKMSSHARPASESGEERTRARVAAPGAARVSFCRAAASESKNDLVLSLEAAAPTRVDAGTTSSGW